MNDKTSQVGFEHDALDAALVFVREKQGAIRYWNSGLTSLYGYRQTETVGRNAHTLLQTRFPKPLPEIQGELERDGVWSGELLQRRNDGTTIVVVSHWTLFETQAGQALVTETCNDISAHRARADYLAAIVQSTDDAIIGKTLGGVVTSWNKAAEEMLGFSATEMVGHPVTKILPRDRLRE